jgi:hypothetical protein
VIFFTDENISEYLARMLEFFDRKHQIKAHADHFDKGVPDVKWMRGIVEKWGSDVVAICGDGRILTNKAERKVLRECSLMFVHLASGWTRLPWEEQAWKFIKAWPSIVKEVSEANQPMLFQVSVNGKVSPVGRVSSL